MTLSLSRGPVTSRPPRGTGYGLDRPQTYNHYDPQPSRLSPHSKHLRSATSKVLDTRKPRTDFQVGNDGSSVVEGRLSAPFPIVWRSGVNQRPYRDGHKLDADGEHVLHILAGFFVIVEDAGLSASPLVTPFVTRLVIHRCTVSVIGLDLEFGGVLDGGTHLVLLLS